MSEEQKENFKELTVKTGFIYHEYDKNGRRGRHHLAGTKVKVDLNSESFKGQRIKFLEFSNGTLFEKKPAFNPPTGLEDKKDNTPTGVNSDRIDNKKPKQDEPEKDSQESKGNPHTKGHKDWIKWELTARGVEFDSKAKKSELAKLFKETLDAEKAAKTEGGENSESEGKPNLVKVSDLPEGEFPEDVNTFDFSSAGVEYLEAWAAVNLIDVPEGADAEALEKALREGLA